MEQNSVFALIKKSANKELKVPHQEELEALNLLQCNFCRQRWKVSDQEQKQKTNYAAAADMLNKKICAVTFSQVIKIYLTHREPIVLIFWSSENLKIQRIVDRLAKKLDYFRLGWVR